MPLFKIIPQTEGLLGIWQLSETSDELLSYFSVQELNDPDYLRYTHEKRKVEWLATRVLMKQLIGSDFTVSYAETGKPILNHTRYKHLTISHSRHFVVVFTHEKHQVGIDIEDTSRNYNSIEKRYLSEAELLQVSKSPLLQCLYWCAKEAVFKLVPDHDIEFRSQILVSPFDPQLEDHFTVQFSSGKADSIYKLQFQTFAGHCMVWVVDSLS